jgi:hypothetical protein
MEFHTRAGAFTTNEAVEIPDALFPCLSDTVRLTWSAWWVLEKYLRHPDEFKTPFSGQNEADLCLEVCS